MIFDGFSLLIMIVVVVHSAIALMHRAVIGELLANARHVASTQRVVNPLRSVRPNHYVRLLKAKRYLTWSIPVSMLAVLGSVLRHAVPLSSYIYVGAFLAIGIGMGMYARSLIKAADARLERRKIALGIDPQEDSDKSLEVIDSADFR